MKRLGNLAVATALAVVTSPPIVRAADPPKPTGPILADITLKGSIPDDPTPIGLDGAPMSDNLKGLIDRIAKAKKDENVKGLMVRLRHLRLGWAKSYELRQAIKDFRSSGKRTVALLEEAENADYLVATAA